MFNVVSTAACPVRLELPILAPNLVSRTSGSQHNLLVVDRDRSQCESGDARQDFISGFGPQIRLAGGVGRVNELANRGLQRADAVMHTPTQLFRFEGGKPPLDEIQPRRVGGREM